MNRVLGVVVVILAVLVDGFFALVNFYPVAPARGRGPQRKVLVALDASQARWLTDNLVDEFNREHNVDVSLVPVDEERLLAELEKAKAGGGELMLAAIPRALGARAIKGGLTRSFEDTAPRAQLAADLAAVTPPVMRAAEFEGKQYFLPRWSLLDVTVYRESRVRDAVRHWSLLRREIDAALKAANGRGLPPGYQLELQPEEWDGYDRFVIGYYWARRRYAGQPARGRVAHRTGEELDGVVDITEGIYRAGAGDATIADTSSQAARDYFEWEALYRKHGLYNAAMFDVKPLDDDGILDGLQRGELFLATVDQMQAFTLHGGSHTGTPPHVDDPDDLGFAPLARISSVELSPKGHPARAGQPFSFREDWVWALPSKSADPALAYELVKFLWEREQHYRECEALGALPLRTDVMRERSSLFKLVWMDDVFDATFTEWDRATPLPDSVAGGLGSSYAQLWDRIVTARAAPDAIAGLLHAPPAPRPPPAPAPAPATTDTPAAAVAAREDDDDDSMSAVDDELWRGRVELEKTGAVQ
jgi:Bacterial extracellular solute-binding protein